MKAKPRHSVRQGAKVAAFIEAGEAPPHSATAPKRGKPKAPPKDDATAPMMQPREAVDRQGRGATLTLNLHLSEDVVRHLKAKAAELGYRRVSHYAEKLLREGMGR